MTYLITQTFILLLVAALLGVLLGWYLTRLSAASERASWQARQKLLENDAAKLRAELDGARSAKNGLEAERQAMLTEIDELKAQVASGVEADMDQIEALRSELEGCRDALARQAADTFVEVEEPVAQAVGSLPAVGEEIPSVNAAAAAAAARLLGLTSAPREVKAPPAEDAGQADDDLQQIKGIGPKIAGILKQLGIRRFEQIAEWTPDNVAKINDHLKFKGRVERERWIPQAQALIDAREAD
jgi:predicted flap endonuclease-1-like 5' DNA nuclease